MGRRRSVAQLTKDLEYAKNKEAYKRPDREENSATRRLPRVDYAYKPMAIDPTGTSVKKYKIQASKEGVEFFTAAALNLTTAATEEGLPRGAKPSKVYAMVSSNAPKVVRAVASKRPYIRYGKGERSSNSQYTYTAPISITTAAAIDTEVKQAFDAVRGKVGGAYGRMWFSPEYFIIADSGE